MTRGLDKPEPMTVDPKGDLSHALQLSPTAVVDTFRALVIMVDFSDNPASGGSIFAQAIDFKNLVFSNNTNDNHYSATEFYFENSFGKFLMQGDVLGWYRMPQTYAYYVNAQNGFGPYPQNAQKLAEDALQAANPYVNYANYDNNGDGWLDGVFIVHAGPGAESTGNDNQIWSHKWNLSSTLILDGTRISAYTMEPEEMGGGGLVTMGVFAHEYGHFLGLPDLYDTDYSSEGIGDWSLMAGGSWNVGGRYPAFMDAWCKSKVAFLNPTNVTSSITGVALPASVYNPVAYRLWENGTVGSQYFLIENRQRLGHDYGLPGDGLEILHVDESYYGNSNEPNYEVAVEQADGQFHLENNANAGDGGDLWSTRTKTAFDDLSTPNTRKHNGATTKTAVWDISASDSVMTASFDVSYSHPRFEMLSGVFSDSAFGNGNGVVEVGERVTFKFNVQNLWLTATNVTATMTSDNNDIAFVTPTVNIGTVTGAGGTGSNGSVPIVFDVPTSFQPCVDSFYVEVSSDNPYGTKVFGFQLNVGAPQILVVDDDNGGSWEQAITSRLFARRDPFDIWDKSALGSPTGAKLSSYPTVIWTIGNARTNIISAADITALKSFLDGGGHLFLTGQSIVGEINTDDQSFLNNYLRATYVTTQLWPFMQGQAGSPIGNGIKIRYGSQTNQTQPQTMTAVNGSIANFALTTYGGVTAITYEGTYRLALFSFGFEAISDQFTGQGYALPDTVFERVMSFLNPSAEPPNPRVTAAAIPGETVTNVLNHAPTFLWSATDTSAHSIIEHEVMVGTGDRCQNSDDMWHPPVFSGADMSVGYAGTAMVDGAGYVFHVRVNNGVSWSSWKKLPFHVNAPPVPGIIGAPSNEQMITTTTPELRMSVGSDPDGDHLTYNFEVYSDPGLTNLVASAVGVPSAAPVVWTVNTPLPEDGHCFWRGRAWDGFQYSPWTETATFYVNAVNQAPNTFSLMSPANGGFVFDLYPRLTWHRAIDADPGDSIKYTLWTSQDQFFGTYTETANLADTFRTLTYPLTAGQTYYWKVKAADLASASTWSSSSFNFKVKATGCCLARRGNANGDAEDKSNISDVTYLVTFLFGTPPGPEPPCWIEGNVNGDADEKVNISDVTFLITYLFGSPPGPQPPLCP